MVSLDMVDIVIDDVDTRYQVCVLVLAWAVVSQGEPGLVVLGLLVVGVGGGPVQALLGGRGGSAAPSLLLAPGLLLVGGGPLEVGGGHLYVPHPLPSVQGTC